MGQVNVNVNGRDYVIGCEDGEEAHLIELGRFIDRRVADIIRAVGHTGDAKLMLMASLMVSDELSSALHRIERLEAELAQLSDQQAHVQERIAQAEAAAASAIETAAKRVARVAERLEAA